MAGKEIIFLHGWTNNHYRYQKLLRRLKKRGYHVFFPSLPGFGKEKLTKPWTLLDYCHWLREKIFQEGIKSFVLIGHSNGGRIAAFFSKEKPKGLEKLVLISASGIKSKKSIKKLGFYLLSKSGKFLFSPPGLKLLAEKARKFLYFLAREQDYYKADKMLAKTMLNLINFDLETTFSKIKLPTLLLWGLKDKTTPLNEALEMKKKIKGSQLVLFPNFDHTLPYHGGKSLVGEIDSFIKE